MNRLGITPTQFYWELTPAEFHYALTDYKDTQQAPMKAICETLRQVAVTVHNYAGFGRRKSKMISDPKKLWTFSWEKDEQVRVQSVEEMKSFMLGLSHLKGVKVTKANKAEE